jgi:hypothetical protein
MYAEEKTGSIASISAHHTTLVCQTRRFHRNKDTTTKTYDPM